MRTGGELPYMVCDLNREAVVQVAGQHEDRLAELIPELDQFLALGQKYRPGIVFVLGRDGSARTANMRNREVH